MPAASTITGYYRYTDIWFEWNNVLPNPSDGSPLKAILAHDALVHPDHPLHEDGVDGIKLYIGTFEKNGQSRLLFSSAQVDYIRYWLHAMGLTKDLIPLPYSDCLLTNNDVRVSTIVLKDGGEVRNALRKIDKINKRLKGADSSLTSRRLTFNRVRDLWSERKGVWCAIDFEGWEREHEVITEFGWSCIHWQEGREIVEEGHFTVKEHSLYTNGTYVPERRNFYAFGQSQELPKGLFKTGIHQLFDKLRSCGSVFLVFHDCSQDIKYLTGKTVEVPLENLSYNILDATTAPGGLYVIDTSDLFAALLGDGSGNRSSLERMTRHLQIPTENLHNAGNDAHYTLVALKSMASGETVDEQRERRWPNHTAQDTGLKVQFQPWEEDSEYEDEDGGWIM